MSSRTFYYHYWLTHMLPFLHLVFKFRYLDFCFLSVLLLLFKNMWLISDENKNFLKILCLDSPLQIWEVFKNLKVEIPLHLVLTHLHVALLFPDNCSRVWLRSESFAICRLSNKWLQTSYASLTHLGIFLHKVQIPV